MGADYVPVSFAGILAAQDWRAQATIPRRTRKTSWGAGPRTQSNVWRAAARKKRTATPHASDYPKRMRCLAEHARKKHPAGRVAAPTQYWGAKSGSRTTNEDSTIANMVRSPTRPTLTLTLRQAHLRNTEPRKRRHRCLRIWRFLAGPKDHRSYWATARPRYRRRQGRETLNHR